MLHGVEAQLLAQLGIDFLEILLVGVGNQDVLDTHAQGRQGFLLEAADGQGLAPQINLAGHGQGVPHGDALQDGQQHGGDGQTRAGTIFGDGALGEVDMQILLLEHLGVDLEGLASAADVAQRRLGAFLHDVAQLAREGEQALAGHLEGFDEQHIAADRGPGQTRHHAHAGSLQALVLKELHGAQQLVEALVVQDEFLLQALLRHAAGHLAAHGADLALQLAQAGLPRVARDDRLQGLLWNGQLLSGDAVLLQLLGNQVLLGDAHLLFQRVAVEVDDFHAVPEGRVDGLQLVGVGHEQHLGKVQGHVQVVVPEGVVLLGIQHLQQGRTGIAPLIAADLVHLVQHDHGVHALDLVQGLHDATGHGAHVGAAVAPDLAFVMHAAQGDARVLAPQGPGDGLAQGRLAHARGAHETQDGAAEIGLQLAYRQEFQQAVLDLGQPEVILVQHGLGLLEIEVVLGHLAPGQFGHPLQVGARHRGFAGIRMHAFQLLEVALDFDQRLLGHLQLGQPVAERRDFLGQLRALAQLLLDGLELLAQVVLPLALVHLAAGFHGDFLLYLQQLDLPREQLVHALEPQARMDDLQDFLGLLQLQVQVRRHQVRQAARVIQVPRDDQHLLGQGLPQGHGLFQGLLHAAHEGVQLQIWRLHLRLGQGLHAGLEQVFRFGEVLHAHPLQALHQGADAAVRQLEHPHDEGRRAHLVEILGPGVVHLHLLLRQQQDHAVLHQGRVHGADGLLAADAKGQDDVRVDHHVPQGQHRQFFRQLGGFVGRGGQENVVDHGKTSAFRIPLLFPRPQDRGFCLPREQGLGHGLGGLRCGGRGRGNSAPPQGRLLVHEALQGPHEIRQILEVAVHAGETDVGHLIQPLQLIHDQLAQLAAADLAIGPLHEPGLQVRHQILDAGQRHGPLLAGQQQALHELLAVKGLAPAILLEDHQGQLLHPFVAGEAAGAGQAFAPPADGIALPGLPGVHHLVLDVPTEGTVHESS